MKKTENETPNIEENEESSESEGNGISLESFKLLSSVHRDHGVPTESEYANDLIEQSKRFQHWELAKDGLYLEDPDDFFDIAMMPENQHYRFMEHEYLYDAEGEEQVISSNMFVLDINTKKVFRTTLERIEDDELEKLEQQDEKYLRENNPFPETETPSVDEILQRNEPKIWDVIQAELEKTYQLLACNDPTKKGFAEKIAPQIGELLGIEPTENYRIEMFLTGKLEKKPAFDKALQDHNTALEQKRTTSKQRLVEIAKQDAECNDCSNDAARKDRMIVLAKENGVDANLFRKEDWQVMCARLRKALVG